MLPESLAPYLRPKPGQLLVERCEDTGRRGLIWLPRMSHESRVSAEAVVYADNTGQFKKGDRVLLAPSVSRRITLGATGSLVLWVCEEDQVVCDILEDGVKVEPKPADTFQHYRSDEDLEDIKDGDLRWQEGEPAPFEQV